jgi:hypothetical protein
MRGGMTLKLNAIHLRRQSSRAGIVVCSMDGRA